MCMGALHERPAFLTKSTVSRVRFLSLTGKRGGKSSEVEAGLRRSSQQVWTAMEQPADSFTYSVFTSFSVPSL